MSAGPRLAHGYAERPGEDKKGTIAPFGKTVVILGKLVAMTVVEKVDRVLHIIYSKKYISVSLIHFEANISWVDLHGCLDLLLKEGYIKIHVAELPNYKPYDGPILDDYSITVMGVLFYESGGYSSKVKNERRKTIVSNSKDYLLISGTWGATIAALSQMKISIFHGVEFFTLVVVATMAGLALACLMFIFNKN